MASASTKTSVAIIGGTGKTGKWALKGAIIRGYEVRVLGRSPDKVKTILEELFPGENKIDQVTVVKGNVSDKDKLVELFTGADVVMSFLGMVKPPEWVVRPGVESIMEAVNACEKKPKFMTMSSIAVGESLQQGRRAWGRFTVCLVWNVFLKQCFKDMEAAERYIMDNRDGLNITILRATILDDKKDYLKDYSKKGEPSYRLVALDDKKSKLTMKVDRQAVAEAFLDQCQSSEFDGKEMSIFAA